MHGFFNDWFRYIVTTSATITTEIRRWYCIIAEHSITFQCGGTLVWLLKIKKISVCKCKKGVSMKQNFVQHFFGGIAKRI